MSQRASSSQQASREAIARAVQARLSGPSASGSSGIGSGGNGEGNAQDVTNGSGSNGSGSTSNVVMTAKEEQEHCLKLRRIIDLQIRRDSGYEKAAECLQTLHTILSNIVAHPSEPKYRSFKAENPRMKRAVLDVPGGSAFLLQAGFGTRTKEFKEEWYISPSVQPPPSTETSPSSSSFKPWTKLSLSLQILASHLSDSLERAQREKERAQREADIEASRASVALNQAAEDRDKVKRRSEAESRARKRVEEEKKRQKELETSSSSLSEPGQEAQEADEDTDPASMPLPGSLAISRDDYTREIPFDAPSHRSVENDGPDADPGQVDQHGERPPPYGSEHWGVGQRLGDR